MNKRFVFAQFKNHLATEEQFASFIEKYIEDEHYLEITDDLFSDNSMDMKKTETGNFLENTNVTKYTNKTNPSALFTMSSEENSSDSLHSQSSNSSAIIEIINETIEGSSTNMSRTVVVNLLKEFYSTIMDWLNRHEKEPVRDNAYGVIREHGLFGMEKDVKAAYQAFNTSALKGHAPGLYNLARANEFAIGCDRDPKKAVVLYRGVAKLGYPKGLYRYALICLKNDEVPLGLNYMRQAMLAKEKELKQEKKTKNNPIFIHNCPYFYHLGTLYMINHSQLMRDMPYAYTIFLRGAKLGCKHSMFMVAEFHEKGTTVPRDMQMAYKYYAEAAALDQSDAQVKIGRQLVTKVGKRSVGVSFLEKAAFSGNTTGMVALGDIYYAGSAIDRDVLQALWWYRIAETMGVDVRQEIAKAENYITHNRYSGF